MSTKKLTPLMEQYWSIKNDHPEKVVLFRMGDFFEMFHQDAEIAAPILNIALTQRNKKSGDETKMCGVPHHSIAGPISKLLRAGYKVAICDQVEDPKLAKGLVKREVTRVLTPGLVYDPETLDQLSANYISSFGDSCLAFIEPSTGECFYYRNLSDDELQRLLFLQQPVEVVLTAKQKASVQWSKLQTISGFEPHMSLHEELDEDTKYLPEAARRLVAYVKSLQGEVIAKSLGAFEERNNQYCLEISATVKRHLELDETYKGEKKGSLFQAINRTQTWAGARLLKSWMHFPLADKQLIEQRWSHVEEWTLRPAELQDFRKRIQNLGDIERRLGKIANPNCNARDLLALADSLECGLSISGWLKAPEEDLLRHAQAVSEKIHRLIVEEPPLSIKDGGLIRRGVQQDLDELIDLSQNSQRLVVEMEASEKEKTGISTLKIRYNNVFGFYIEVTKAHSNKVPSNYMRKQTLTNAERFTTDELNRLEEKVLSAKGRRSELEAEIFHQLKTEVLDSVAEFLILARQWSELDVITSLAWLALEQKYCRPHWSVDQSIHLKASRHPVVEQERMSDFIPNDIEIEKGGCLLLTGPNMAGKSTLMRQVALTVILSQMGSFVPASQASLPLVDRLFTRVGASDHLSEGLSTFMVEMKETADILKWATPQSLVILDEIGRGTSTYDGMSLAQSILEYLVTQMRVTSLFATHYHELTLLSSRYPQIQNAHMSIREKSGDIHFLHLLQAGPANKSYGIHVAKLAGLPSHVTKRAHTLLAKLEMGLGVTAEIDQLSLGNFDTQFIEPPQEDSKVSEEVLNLLNDIKDLSVQELTPLEALNRIAQWQRHLS